MEDGEIEETQKAKTNAKSTARKSRREKTKSKSESHHPRGARASGLASSMAEWRLAPTTHDRRTLTMIFFREGASLFCLIGAALPE